VGVYKTPVSVDEDTVINPNELLPYGANRYYLETVCSDMFDTTVIRLPGLFGAGLKKNVIFDLLNDNNVEKIHAAGVYQYYDLGNIWKDINVALVNNLEVVNFATEPVATKEVAKYAFGIDFDNMPSDIKPALWDMRTKHASVYGGIGGYLYSKEQELKSIKEFVIKTKADK
jgi:nucleoside-diphosphate-sugar epimerase